MKFSVVALLTAVVSTVYAQTPANAGVAVNLPSVGQVLNAGTSFTITWTVDTNTTASSSINSIALMKGNAATLETYIPNILSAPIPVNPPSYNWAIPASVETNPSYVLVFAGNNGASTYSTYFTIIGAAPGTTNGTLSAAVSSPAASSGVPASGSAAASASASKPTASGNATTTSPTSGAGSLKAGMVGVAGVAGAIALLL